MHARGVRIRARVAPRGMNQPNRADRFVLPEGERKLSYERDTKVENAGTFVLQREDHTLGNVLRMCAVLPSNSVLPGRAANARKCVVST